MADWNKQKLGDICTIDLGKTPARADASYWDKGREGRHVWLSIADLLSAENNIVTDSKEYISDAGAAISKIVKKGTLLASFKLTLGRLAFAGRDLYTNEAIAALSIRDKKNITSDFLYWCLRHFDWNNAAANDVKLKGMTLNKEKLKNIEISFPHSIVEQQRIVALLDEAFEAIATAKANTEKNLQNARALFESHLAATFGANDADWREGALEGIVHPQCTLSYGIVQPGDEYADGVPIVRPTDLKQKYIELDGLKRVDPEIADAFRRTKLVGDEFLLCVRGATGAVSIATPELAGGNVTRGIVPIRFAENRVLPEFAFHLLNAPPVQQQIKEKTYGTALMQINIKDLRELRISLPPLKAQKSLAAHLDDLYDETRALESIYARKQAALDSLKTSLLHQAFTGNL